MAPKQDRTTHLHQEVVEMLYSEPASIAKEGSSMFLVQSLTPAHEPNLPLRGEGEDGRGLWLSNAHSSQLHI